MNNIKRKTFKRKIFKLSENLRTKKANTFCENMRIRKDREKFASMKKNLENVRKTQRNYQNMSMFLYENINIFR